jgi:uncharacterized protein YndB with AHSA1/START domain
MNKLTIAPEGDRHIVVTRRFAAPPQAVYRAHTECRLLQQWLLGPDGWSMPRCQCEARPGGRYRYDWAHPQRAGFWVSGEFVTLEPYRRIVQIERMYLPDPTPENQVETVFAADGSGTLMTLRMTLPDERTRAAMLATGMAAGMEASYQRLERQGGYGGSGPPA